MGKRSDRKVFRDAKHRLTEAWKLYKRARKTLSEELRTEITDCLKELKAARKNKDLTACVQGLERLDVLAPHLLKFRKSALREYSESIGLAVLFALLLRAFVVEAFQIPSRSMVPTLLVGDHLFVNKFVYGVRIPFTKYDLIRFDEPERGDVVVFIFPVEEVRTQATLRTIMEHLNRAKVRSTDGAYPESLAEIGLSDQTDGWENAFIYERVNPTEYRLLSRGPDGEEGTVDDLTNLNSAIQPGDRPCLSRESLEESKDYIKRVIGTPGDRIRLENNVIYVNDEPIEQTELPDPGEVSPLGIPVIQSMERIGDTEYLVQYHGASGNFDEIVVREEHIFVMGDNRDDSSDSRCWGQVPIENVKGEALFIFWSSGSDGGFLGNRWGRMLNGID